MYLIIFLLIAFSNSDNLGLTILYSVIIIPIGAIFAIYAGKVYCWAWLAFCQKYNPGRFASSIASATDRGIVGGYLLGGHEGAKSGFAGVLIIYISTIWIYLLKGQLYFFKYINLEKKLKDQLNQNVNLASS